MFTALRRTVSLLIAALGVLSLAEPIRAQSQTQTQASQPSLEEVVVTARRREESRLDVPVTVDVFTQQTIESAGIEAPRDFVALVPNMTLVEVQNVGNSFITIRGISQARNSEPSDHFEGEAKVGVGSGVSERAQLAVGGPIDSAGTLKYRASVDFYNTDGYLENTYLDRKADPYREYSGRLRLLWKPSDQWTADLRTTPAELTCAAC